MKKKLIFIFIMIFIIIIGVITKIITNKNIKKNLNTIKVAEVTHSLFYTPFYVAIENGYFKDYGINIDLLLVSGSDNVAASVLSKDTDIGLAGPESAVFVYLGGEEDYLQVFSGLTKKDGQFILSRNKDFDWNDLIGKEILVGRASGMPAMSFFKALDNKGIKKSDVKINTSIEFAELSGAFIGGEGDFVNLFEPLATKLENNNSGYVVTSVGDASDNFPYTAFYAKKSFINNNEELLSNFNKAIKKGMDFTLNNDSKTIASIVYNQFKDSSIDDIETVINRYKEADVWQDTPYLEEDFYNTLINLLKENNLINKDAPYNNLVKNINE